MTGSRRALSVEEGRHGFTLIELLVVMSIIALLVALISPAIQSAREAARRTECLNHLKELAQGAYHHAGAHGRLPAFDEPLRKTSQGAAGWALAILPELDARGAHNQLCNGQSVDIAMEVFTCPGDEANWDVTHGLSYVANRGYANWPADSTSPKKTTASGVFFPKKSLSLDEISQGDGLAHTILFAEQTRPGNWRNNTNSGFQVDLNQIVPPVATLPLGSDPATLKLTGVTGIGANAPNRSSAGPSSRHPGGVNVAMCDGRARPLSATMDRLVYLRLVTSAGTQYGQRLVGDDY